MVHSFALRYRAQWYKIWEAVLSVSVQNTISSTAGLQGWSDGHACWDDRQAEVAFLEQQSQWRRGEVAASQNLWEAVDHSESRR